MQFLWQVRATVRARRLVQVDVDVPSRSVSAAALLRGLDYQAAFVMCSL